MLTGELRNKVDRIWDAFWSGGIANPIEVIDQITYLLFVRRLDELHTLGENKANATGKPISRRIFPDGEYTPDERVLATRPAADLRWPRFSHFAPAEMFTVLGKIAIAGQNGQFRTPRHIIHPRLISTPSPLIGSS